MRRYVLPILFLLIPFTSAAEPQSISSPNGVTPEIGTEAAALWKGIDLNSPITEWAPYGNPYAPSSLTNFETFITPYRLSFLGQGAERDDFRSPADSGLLENGYDGFDVINSQFDKHLLHHDATYEFFRR